MSDDTEDALLQQLESLRANYLARLPDELVAMAALADNLEGSEQDRPRLDELNERLHKLAGSGGSFGCMALSLAARALERRVKGWLAGNALALDGAARQQLREELGTLGNTVTGDWKAPALSAAKAADSASGKSQVLWLVEDDLDLGQQLKHQLESFNFRVRLFAGLDEADRAALQEQPDLLLLDVMLEHGTENATESIRHYAALWRLGCPLLFISAYDDFASRVRAAQLGAMGYCLKPIDMPHLIGRITRIFEQQRASPERVLIVDDDEDLAEHMRLVLISAGMTADILRAPEQIVKTIADFHPELVLMDLHMPGYSGSDLAGVIRQHENHVNLPIVYLSAETDVEQQIEAMNNGADDFLIKPILNLQLVAAVRVRIARARQLTEQISKDSLTGLLKHASIKEATDREVQRARRLGKPVTVAMLDIDHFKAVNDTHGHAVGDVVIAALATLLRQSLRQSDTIGRYGGEEFLAILPECDQQSAHRLLDEIRRRFADLRFTSRGETFFCTISIGLACSTHRPDANGENLMQLSDEALYKAKRNGRNQVQEASKP